MIRIITGVLLTFAAVTPAPAATRLTLDDKASVWPRAAMDAKIDFTDRMGRAMRALSPDLDNRYFMRCLEETANIGDTKDLTLNDMVRTCVSLHGSGAPE
ncbi:hypothetical protein Q8W71_14685 [Methylobacterium sp. NEAU 140]|uniref:hypothetical protein n=1 Tax=Methylobacterium sp. NEAU 140 TaxID=3064945 RepID=UPI0027328ACB|nr:hypothetical protein [Methylobacterium sp. NEAU 140]MDP4023879.1 hypothetical protein [Methylobacterium sp. NEAU 140]